MNNKSVSNVIYRSTYEKSKHNKRLRDVFNSCDITQYEIERPNGRITEEQHLRLLSLLNSDPEDEGYLINNMLENTISASYSLFPELISYCINQENMGKAIMGFVNNSCIIGNCDYFSVSQNQDQTKISFLNSSLDSANRINALGNFALLSDLIHLYAPKAELKVSLKANRIASKRQFDDKFESQSLLDQNENSIIINNGDLRHSHNSYNKTLNALQENQLREIKSIIFDDGSFAAAVKEIIFDIVFSRKVSEQYEALNILCDTLQVSRWTLNRRLSIENTNFRNLLSEVKLHVAVKLLTEERLTMQEVSDWLAFSSHSAFSRFFKAQTGHSPRIYRAARV